MLAILIGVNVQKVVLGFLKSTWLGARMIFAKYKFYNQKQTSITAIQ